METINIYIADNCPQKKAYKWIVETFSSYTQTTIIWSDNGIIIGDSQGKFAYNQLFWETIKNKTFSIATFLDKEGYVIYHNKQRDLLSTAFFYINCIFEKDEDLVKDEIGRFEFSNSIWNKYQIDFSKPFVNKVFDELAKEIGVKFVKRNPCVWLTHDIDSTYGAWKQDGKWLLNKKRFFHFFKVALEHFFIAPQWMNLKKIALLEKSFGMQSTFFMLTQKGRIDQRKVNSDYDISDKKIQKELKALKELKFEIGIHKSLNTTSYSEEISYLFPTKFNRNHYLSFNWPTDLHQMNNAGILLDGTLGYAEMYGYRNGYSLPFYPFDIETNSVIPVLEVPLTFMDGTFSSKNYLNVDSSKVFKLITDYISNNEENSVFTILWHNSHFTNYKFKGFADVYIELLKHFKSKNIQVVTANEILNLFPNKHNYK